MNTECDNRPVLSPVIPVLQYRPSHPDIDTPQDFVAERGFPAGETLRLGVCSGEVHMVPSEASATLRITVHVTQPLPRDLTPKSYLQELTVYGQQATMGWKLPESSHAVIYVYVPRQTSVDIQLGRGNLEIKGVEGNKLIHVGKGEAKLNLSSALPEYSHMTIHVSMGTFEDRRVGGHNSHKVPLKEEFSAEGLYSADIHVAMGKVVLLPS